QERPVGGQRRAGGAEDDPGGGIRRQEKRRQGEGAGGIPGKTRRGGAHALPGLTDRRGDAGERRPHPSDSTGFPVRAVPAAPEVTYTVRTSFMATQTIALLVQAAGTILLFVVLLLLYRKFRRPAFLDWIASWGFFLIGTGLLPLVRDTL